MVHPTHFNQILGSLMTAVIVLDSDLHVYCLNSSAEMLLGVSSEHVVGKSILDCITPVETAGENLLESLKLDSNYTMRQAKWELHNHNIITIDYSVTPSAELDAVIIEVQPLDRLLRITREEAMQATAETSRNLIRSMAHEIKNPLGGIRGAAQLLARELNNIDKADEFDEYTQVIIDEADRLRNLVDRMLGPHHPPQRNLLNIHEVLEHVMTVLRAETGKSIQLDRDYDPSIPMVPGDRELLIQAILNIGRNAMQVLQEHDLQSQGKITFSTRVQRRFTIGRTQYPLVTRIGISDNGPGIAPELIEDIFFPMITGRAEGTGLGLAIAQNLVGQHSGIIECESQPGLTEFFIYLPLGNHNAQT